MNISSNNCLYQHTLRNSFTCVSPGLHTGANIAMCVSPSEVNTGIVFIRHDVETPRAEIRANWNNVKETRLSTTIGNRHGTRVSTIEHLMAALYANGVDNARVIVDGPEVPIMDGSAKPFVELIKQAGKVKQHNERRAIIIKQIISVSDGVKFAGFSPSSIPWMDVKIDFKATPIGQQMFSAAIRQEVFNNELAAARTFGFKEQIETLHKLGLALGGSLENTMLIDKDKIINEEGLRFDNEFVKHKMIDAIGDIALIGARVIGQFTGECNGHKINNSLIQKLMANESTWEYTTVREAIKYWNDQKENSWNVSFSAHEKNTDINFQTC